MFPYIRVGSYLLQLQGLALLVGVWVGLSFAERESKRLKMKPEHISNLIFYSLIAGIVGARLFYAFRYSSSYLADPLSLFSLSTNTFASTEGVLTSILAAILYGRNKRLNLKITLDALAPGFAAFMIAVGVSHILSGDAFGAPSQLPWAIFLWEELRHPTQIYETVLALGILVLILKRPLGNPGSGSNFLLFITLTAVSRLFLEAFRGDSIVLASGIRSAQVISLIVMVVCLWIIPLWLRHPVARKTK
ncbi:MAG: hypothetical protein DWQ07_18410 [Chloroflexi bacterium]|nr:MAG: hypothetical protein DWQ07_18410 [Chloroflexota bacterium]